MATNLPVTADTPITIKITINGISHPLKLPFKELSADVLPDKLRSILKLPVDQQVTFERFSDSADRYVTLDPKDPAVFKTLIRAAKAKLKLRLRATVPDQQPVAPHPAQPSAPPFLQSTPQGTFAKQLQEDVLQQQRQLQAQASDSVFATPHKQRSLSGIRDSTALDRHSVGHGIFDFKNDRAASSSQQVELPKAMPDISAASAADMVVRTKAALETHKAALEVAPTWSVYCNDCDTVMDDVHFHCSICDGGDYDLCLSCVDAGKLCPGEGHWLVRRSIKDGQVVSSTTTRLPPKKQLVKAKAEKDKMPGSFTDDAKSPTEEDSMPTRTCNSCVNIKAESEFVTCVDCDDFDLCLPCHIAGKHGHHPAHSFKPVTALTKLNMDQKSLLEAGRNVNHAAVCDGCDTYIRGVRHKCFTCPDFDYCHKCVKTAEVTHPSHRFAAVYEPIPINRKVSARHSGIYCDGPVCSAKPSQGFIHGIRYKCVVCHDTDFCANCEAMPGFAHNPTHPLLKLSTPVRGLNVSTVNQTPQDTVNGLGDRDGAPAVVQSISKTSLPSNNSTSTVQTVADIKPTAPVAPATTPIQTPVTHPASAPTMKPAGYNVRLPVTQTSNLEAHFVKDAIADGMVMSPKTPFTQIWIMRNPGPKTWPAGCSVRYVGGDSMFNIDNRQVSSAGDLSKATESSVVSREVKPGEEVAFKVMLRSPHRLGKAISYWRVKSPDGVAFGHRLWCDITIKSLGPGNVDHMKPFLDYKAAMLAKIQEHPAYRNRAQQLPVSANMPPPTARACFPMDPTCSPSAQTYYTQYQQRIQGLREVEQRLKDLHRERVSRMSAAYALEKQNAQAAEAAPQVIKTETSKKTDPRAQKDGEEIKGSKMIFPTLDKESPANSVHQPMTSTTSTGAEVVVHADTGTTTTNPVQFPEPDAPTAADTVPEATEEKAAIGAAAVEGFDDLADELELLSADGKDSDDGGFFTDEEYDILDASDQETIVSA